ncbi:hypothetical protein CNYM01_01579 [Colletotrichum nymphaeae SA-01]|uniref:Uncharacterized protein n=1 Tax=Colletotrichum nymphaeae SA-01 TaxID=1460502 RepID=A0A135UIX4_9PEZI|nr:hypothetical protein CNYM01_01579 [Colletotrichum nymphaeae SA-01]
MPVTPGLTCVRLIPIARLAHAGNDIHDAGVGCIAQQCICRLVDGLEIGARQRLLAHPLELRPSGRVLIAKRLIDAYHRAEPDGRGASAVACAQHLLRSAGGQFLVDLCVMLIGGERSQGSRHEAVKDDSALAARQSSAGGPGSAASSLAILLTAQPTCLGRRIASGQGNQDAPRTRQQRNRIQQRIRNSRFAARCVYPPSQESSSASWPIPSAQVPRCDAAVPLRYWWCPWKDVPLKSHLNSATRKGRFAELAEANETILAGRLRKRSMTISADTKLANFFFLFGPNGFGAASAAGRTVKQRVLIILDGGGPSPRVCGLPCSSLRTPFDSGFRTNIVDSGSTTRGPHN